jgi:spermidine synthase
MLGLGVGSYLAGAWADRRYAAEPDAIALGRAAPMPDFGTLRPDGLLRAYGYVELMIGASGLGVSLLLPHLDRISALVSSYSREASGWYARSTTSYLARAGIAVALLTPVTILMGGTLTLLIRHLVRRDVDRERRRIAALYGVNTAGAAFGAFLTDFALVPSLGLRGTQLIAVALNLLIGIGAVDRASRRAEIPSEVGQGWVRKVRLKQDTTRCTCPAAGEETQ